MRFTLHLPEGSRSRCDAGPAGPAQRAQRAGRRRDRLAAGRRAGRDRARAGEVPGHRPPLQRSGRASTSAPAARHCWSTTTATIRANWRRCSPPRAAAGRSSAWWSRSSRTATAARATCSTISPRCCPSVDALVLTEVYAAGEAPIAGADAQVAGARDPRARPHRAGGGRQPRASWPRVLPDVLQDGDLLLLMGAGDIGHVAQRAGRERIHGDGGMNATSSRRCASTTRAPSAASPC